MVANICETIWLRKFIFNYFFVGAKCREVCRWFRVVLQWRLTFPRYTQAGI